MMLILLQLLRAPSESDLSGDGAERKGEKRKGRAPEYFQLVCQS